MCDPNYNDEYDITIVIKMSRADPNIFVNEDMEVGKTKSSTYKT